MSVPVLSDPAPQSPGTAQKTITELLTQWADLTNAAIAATGVTEGWYRGPIQNSRPWDPAAEEVSLPPCGTVGPKTPHRVRAQVTHDAFEADPHPIADKLTAYWESQGFTVVRTVDWTSPSGDMDVSIRATRSDGAFYGLGVTSEIVAITVSSECSTHPSIDTWARERSLRNLKTPTPSPAASVTTEDADDGFFGDDPRTPRRSRRESPPIGWTAGQRCPVRGVEPSRPGPLRRQPEGRGTPDDGPIEPLRRSFREIVRCGDPDSVTARRLYVCTSSA